MRKLNQIKNEPTTGSILWLFDLHQSTFMDEGQALALTINTDGRSHTNCIQIQKGSLQLWKYLTQYASGGTGVCKLRCFVS